MTHLAPIHVIHVAATATHALHTVTATLALHTATDLPMAIVQPTATAMAQAVATALHTVTAMDAQLPDALHLAR